MHVLPRAEELRVVVRGDDFAVLGGSKGLGWHRGVAQQRVEVTPKGKRERGKPGAVRILNRYATVKENGLQHEASSSETRVVLGSGRGDGRGE